MGEYSCDEIQVLKGLEPVRRRPGMYIGDTGGTGLFHMLDELISNVVELHRAGWASELRVELGPDAWVTIRDDGPGLSTEALPDGTSVLEAAFTRMHGVRYAGYRPPGCSLCGFAHAVASALSEQLVVETTHHGVRWSQTFARGERTQPPRRIGPTSVEGTTIRFRADPTIFTTTAVDPHAVRARLQELAWLNPHLRVWFQEQRVVARGGMPGWSRVLAGEHEEIVASHVISHQTNEICVDVALAWRCAGAPVIRSFVNMMSTCGGTHVAGLWRGFRDHARAIESPAQTRAHVGEAIASGLVAIIHVQLDEVRYAGCTRERLTNREAYDAVRTAIASSLRGWRAHATRRFVNERLAVHDPNRGQ